MLALAIPHPDDPAHSTALILATRIACPGTHQRCYAGLHAGGRVFDPVGLLHVRLWFSSSSSAERFQTNRNFTSTCASTVTGLPSFMPGLNRHFFTASMAFSSRPHPKLCRTRMLMALPLAST